MAAHSSKSFCSLIADYYYNRDRKKIGSQVEKIVSEIESLCKRNEFIISMDKLTELVQRKYPDVRAGRVPGGSKLAKKPEGVPYSLLEEKDGIIKILKTVP